MTKKVVLDEVYGEDVLELNDRVDEFVNQEEFEDYKIVNINIHTYKRVDNREFLGASITLVNTTL